jgi:hypothetical protein
MPACFIDDGYTCVGYIEEAEGIHEAVRFEYRPSTARDNAIFYDGLDKADGGEYSDKTAKFVADHLVSWNICDRNGRPVEITPQNCDRLLGVIRARMTQIIQGVEASDPLPDGQQPQHINPEEATKN